MSPQDTQSAALLAHILSRIESDVQFLVSQNYISHSDASVFLSKLPNAQSNAPLGAGANGNRLPPPSAARPSPPAHRAVRAKALWAYNENGEEPDDLSFSAGDIIEIVEETNGDWWMGRVNGKQALFPSSYVEKIKENDASAPSREKPAYRPFGAAYHGMDAPPPSGAGVNSVGLQQDPGNDKKKSKYGKLGNTMAHSAAGGVGFGAGAAIGGGLVRAIF